MESREGRDLNGTATVPPFSLGKSFSAAFCIFPLSFFGQAGFVAQRAIQFHDRAEELWRDTLSSDPPLAVSDLRTRLDTLMGECSGPLMGSMPYLQRAREHAHSLEVAKRVREEPPEDEA